MLLNLVFLPSFTWICHIHHFVSQIISNEEYKSADHRVLANSSDEPRVSIAIFFNPSKREKMFGPLPELTSAEKPALYRNFTFNEFMTRFFKKELDGKSLTNYFRQRCSQELLACCRRYYCKSTFVKRVGVLLVYVQKCATYVIKAYMLFFMTFSEASLSHKFLLFSAKVA